MRYFGYMPNDFINGEGVCVSFWTAGCPHRCPGCHNSEMWDYEKGAPVPTNILDQLINAIQDNGIIRNFSILGGEPLSKDNIDLVWYLTKEIKKEFPNIKIFLWTGFTIEELLAEKDWRIRDILLEIDTLIEGRYEQAQRDITLPLRGSRNQRIFKKEHLDNIIW